MKLFTYITLFLSSICAFAQIDSKIVPGDAQNFEMSKWDDKTSFLDWKIFGDEGKYQEGNVILITKMKLDIFDGSKEENIKINVKSDTAEVFVTTKSVGGDDLLYAKGDNFDLVGKTWLWESTNRKISIFKDLEIEFNAKEDAPKTLANSQIGYFFHLTDENIFELERNVKIVDERSDIECDFLVIKTDKDSMRNSQSSARSIDAKGNVKILWDNQILAHSDALDVNPLEDIALLYGNARLKDIKSDTEVFGDKIELDKSTNKSKVFSSDTQRARALIPQKGDGDKVQIVDIYADEILMTMREEEVEVNFVGNVILKSEDITATCKTMTSFATKPEGGNDFTLLKVIGVGNVVIEQGERSAFAQNFIYTPADTQVVLNDNANMQDEEKGVRINAYTIILDRDQNKAVALSQEGEEKSFVHVQMNEVKKKSDAGISELNIFSRSLVSNKNDADITFNFDKDVKVKSADMQATCQKMNVYAKSDQKGRSQIEKIEAFNDIIIKQAQYIATAQLARIFPVAKLSDVSGEEERGYTELLTSSAKPDKRPMIILPPIGNVGLNEEISEGNAYKNTEITSDRQSLVEGDDMDRYFFEGDVVVDSTDMNATCQKIEVRMNKENDTSAKRISQIVATEDVTIVQGMKIATGGRCDIFPQEEMLALSEEPVVFDGENGTRATGYRMTYRKGVKTVSIEGNDPEAQTIEGEEAPKRQRPTIILPPIN